MVLDAQEDDIASYVHDVITLPWDTIAVLKQKPNGDCLYLGKQGCTIHDRAPKMCREFDCRAWYRSFSRDQRKQIIRNSPKPDVAKAIFAAGRQREGVT